MAGVDEIIRQWVQQVEATGELARNPNFGKPLNLDDGYLDTPEELQDGVQNTEGRGVTYRPRSKCCGSSPSTRRAERRDDRDEQGALRAEVAQLQQKVAMMLDRMARRR